MSIGKRDHLVTLKGYTAAQNGYGEEIKTPTTLGQEWAAVFYGRGDERRQAAMEQGKQPATFQMLSNELTRSLTLTNSIEFEGDWDIEGIAPDMPRRGYIEITAVRRA